MNTNQKKPLKIQIITSIIICSTLAFIVSVGLVLRLYMNTTNFYFAQNVRLTADKKAYELDACFLAVEDSVNEMQDYILRTIDEERILRDKDYEEAYMTELTELVSSIAFHTKDIVSAYFRMEAERFGGNSGIFLEGGSKNGFISIRPTDIKKFSPSDTEHVGWYYAPIWKKAPVWTAPYENKNINIHMISYVVPLYKNDTLLGVVGMDINLAKIKNVIDSLPVEGEIGILIGDDDTHIYHSKADSSQKSVEYSADTAALIDSFNDAREENGQLLRFNWNSSPYYGVSRRLENGMQLVTAIPQATFAGIRFQNLQSIILACVFTTAMITLLLYLAVHNIISPLETITNASVKLARGELYQPIDYRSNNELGILADNIRMMTSQIREYIEHISEQTKKERAAKEAAVNESRSKSKFLASIYLSLHELDLNEDTFMEIQCHDEVSKTIGLSVGNARATVRRVMEARMAGTDKERQDFLNFIDFNTLEERMKNKISISKEFQGVLSYCRARFIMVDRNPDGTLHHVLYAVENIADEKTMRDKLQEERDKMRIEAEKNFAASQAKSSFLANMSHEIRTPINAVLGMDEMILRESRDEEILGYAANIKTAGTNLLSLVNEILDFSKIEAGKMELLPDNYDISSLVVDLVNMISERAKDKGLEFKLNTDPSLPKTLYGDSVRIKQCILNLLTNAVKYTHAGSVIFTLGYQKIDAQKISLCVNVKDSGIGIKKEDMAKLTSPFERIEEGRNKTIEGTGLGMSIVTRLLAMMGSKLDVRSEYGKGSEFSFCIEQPVVDWSETGDINEAYKQSAERMSSYKEKLHAPRARLLFVDDTAMNLEVIKGLLKNTGMTIDTVLSGRQALEKVKETEYNILFIDHRMPEMDGIETLHAMQQLEDNKCTGKPVIVLTANAITGVKKMYLDEGFTDYLSKPVDPDKLEEMICTYLPPDYLEEAPEDSGAAAPDPENAAKEAAFIEKLRESKIIDVDMALKNCSSVELLASAMQTYYDAIEEKSGELQGFYDQQDWQDYRIKVHALKSTSRLIGAMELSDLAAHLEDCANNNDVDEILAKHGTLQDLYRSYLQKLAPFVQREDTDGSEKAEISEDALREELAALATYADRFDISGLDAVLKDLSAFAMPPSFAATFGKIRSAVENVDFKELKTLLTDSSILSGGN